MPSTWLCETAGPEFRWLSSLAHITIFTVIAFRSVNRARARGDRFLRRKRDRDWPEQAFGRPHLVADTAPACMTHETGERREFANAEHHDIALLPRRDAYLIERSRTALLLGARVALELQRSARQRPRRSSY